MLHHPAVDLRHLAAGEPQLQRLARRVHRGEALPLVHQQLAAPVPPILQRQREVLHPLDSVPQVADQAFALQSGEYFKKTQHVKIIFWDLVGATYAI